MGKSYQPPAGVDIASLKNRKRQTTGLDLMRPGEGTPWEDRGALGLVKAFFQTCWKSITSPALLLDHIRRADTPGEGRQFAIGCAALWAISALIHGVIWNVTHPPTWDITWTPDYSTHIYVKIVILSLLVGAAVYFLGVVLATRMYYGLISSELQNAAPRVLLYNIFCYSLGPSLLAPIPLVGPPVALALILFVWCIAGSKRLYISWRGAIVAGVLSMVGVLIIAAAGLFVANIFLNNVLSLRVPTREELGLPPEPTAKPGMSGFKK